MTLIGAQFVLGETVKAALKAAEPYEGKGYRFSFDILGEGARSYVLQTPQGQIAETHSVSAGLDYASIGPEHAYYRDAKRIVRSMFEPRPQSSSL